MMLIIKNSLKYLQLFLLLILSSCYTNCQSSKVKSVEAEQNSTKPNIIFILADDLGYGDLGFNGQDKIKTPVLDKRAKEDIVFTRHYAGSKVCGHSRASLMTGMHTGNSSVRENPRWTKSGKPVDLSVKDITVAEELKRVNDSSGIIGQ